MTPIPDDVRDQLVAIVAAHGGSYTAIRAAYRLGVAQERQALKADIESVLTRLRNGEMVPTLGAVEFVLREAIEARGKETA